MKSIFQTFLNQFDWNFYFIGSLLNSFAAKQLKPWQFALVFDSTNRSLFVLLLRLYPSWQLLTIFLLFFLTRNAVRCSLREHLSYIIFQKNVPRNPTTTSNNYCLNLQHLLFPTTFVSTTVPKSHSLGLTLVRSQTLQSEVAGPRPDGHGHP